MLLFYHFFVTIALSILFPFFYPLKKKIRLRERLGLAFPKLGQPTQKRIWVHALSVGEVLSSIPLIEALRSGYPYREIALSVRTETGLKIAQQNLGRIVDYILPMPIDFWWSSRRIIQAIQPGLFIVVETDIWPGLVGSLKKRGIKTILVNGRISPHTERSYEKWRFIIKRILGQLEACLVQTEIDKKRIMKGGLDSNKIKVTGNIKFDKKWRSMTYPERESRRALFGLEDQPTWIAGSTHYPEEASVLKVFRELLHTFPDLVLIIAPRDMGRFDEVYEFARGKGLKVIRRTDLPVKKHECNVIILNTLGELGWVYGIADVAFVGGSLVKKGGHNLLEPASFGVPVLFGPHTYNFAAMAQSLMSQGGGYEVADEQALLLSMTNLLGDREKREWTGKKAQEFMQRNKGALDRVMEILNPYIEM
jgi:3-deoxy-D-manno-octulosonic-acid transferase